MARFRFPSFVMHAPLAAALLMSSPAHAANLVSEDFSTDPIAAGRAVVVGDADRFDYSPGLLTAHYDSRLATTTLQWDLGRTLNQDTSFTLTARFTLAGNFGGAYNAGGQLAFGLLNAVTTGDNRTGSGWWGIDYSGATTYDVVSFDYYPNLSDFAGFPTLTSTVFDSAGPGATDAFNSIHSIFDSESGLDDPGDAIPQLLRSYIATIDYDAATGVLALRLLDDSGATPIALDINTVGAGFLPGGDDGDPTTIRQTLPDGTQFSVDRLALMLWQDHYTDPSDPSVFGDVLFTGLSVTTTAVPEPTSLAVLALALGPALLRRQR